MCSFREKYSSKKREEEKKSLCDFRKSTRDRFSDYNFIFVYRWIGLIFGQQVPKTRYFILYGWIVDKISEQRDNDRGKPANTVTNQITEKKIVQLNSPLLARTYEEDQ